MKLPPASGDRLRGLEAIQSEFDRMLDENRRAIAADRESNEALRRELNARLALTRKRLQETEHDD